MSKETSIKKLQHIFKRGQDLKEEKNLEYNSKLLVNWLASDSTRDRYIFVLDMNINTMEKSKFHLCGQTDRQTSHFISSG